MVDLTDKALKDGSPHFRAGTGCTLDRYVKTKADSRKNVATFDIPTAVCAPSADNKNMCDDFMSDFQDGDPVAACLPSQ